MSPPERPGSDRTQIERLVCIYALRRTGRAAATHDEETSVHRGEGSDAREGLPGVQTNSELGHDRPPTCRHLDDECRPMTASPTVK
jgi:hypothetical protein